MKKTIQAALIGCGDYLRWEIDNLNESQYLKVKYTYDLSEEKSRSIAGKINATPVTSTDEIFDDPDIGIVLIFTPPWAREELFAKAVKTGKHVITTKPLAPNASKAKELYAMVKGKVQCAVFYGRTGNAGVEKLKEILDSGEIGRLALYKEDWLHHYPTWNNWATDPEKNGGPFMDAMVHNLNKARYLADSKLKSINYFSDNYAQNLKCNDTECMKCNFENGAGSYLFITWAADLEVFDPDGNHRVHIAHDHYITDKGWYITLEEGDDGEKIKAVKEKESKEWDVPPLPRTPYDEFSLAIQENAPLAHDISLALSDIEIMERAMKNITNPLEV